MTKFKKGETAHFATMKYGRLEVAEHTVKGCGDKIVELDGGSSATGYSTRVPVRRAHVTRRAALESVLEFARMSVDGSRKQLADAEAMVERISVMIDKERTPAPSSSE